MTAPMGSTSVDGDVAAAAAHRAADAKARRAARKAERAAIPPPERDSTYDGLSLAELRAARTTLGDEETGSRTGAGSSRPASTSCAATCPTPSGSPTSTRVLTDARSRCTGSPTSTSTPVDDVPPLPDLAELWSRQVDRHDTAAQRELERDLSVAELELSTFRRALHARIDLVTHELIARYREQPLLALQILPNDPLHRHPTP